MPSCVVFNDIKQLPGSGNFLLPRGCQVKVNTIVIIRMALHLRGYLNQRHDLGNPSDWDLSFAPSASGFAVDGDLVATSSTCCLLASVPSVR
jgi:hypothetical protein